MSEDDLARVRTLMCKVVSVLGNAAYQPKATVVEQLCSQGMDRGTAWELATFLPIAYFRLLLERYEGMFPETFILCDLDGATQELAYADQPVYQEALEFGKKAFSLGVDPLRLQAIVTHSCEFREINHMLGESEAPPEEIQLEPQTIYLGDCDDPALMGDDEEPPPPVKAWWEFWK